MAGRKTVRKKLGTSEFPVMVKKSESYGNDFRIFGYHPIMQDFEDSVVICESIAKRMKLKKGYAIVTMKQVSKEEFFKYLKTRRYKIHKDKDYEANSL